MYRDAPALYPLEGADPSPQPPRNCHPIPYFLRHFKGYHSRQQLINTMFCPPPFRQISTSRLYLLLLWGPHILNLFGGWPRVGRIGRPRYMINVMLTLTLFSTPRLGHVLAFGDCPRAGGLGRSRSRKTRNFPTLLHTMA